jgi:hypothetical protein
MGRALILAISLLTAIGMGAGMGAGGGARAADPDGYYTIQGVGIETCEAWLGERLEDGAIAWYKQQWVLGYLTAFNRWAHDKEDIAAGLTSEQLFEWVDNYCQLNTRQTLALATEALIWSLRDRK